ncbi:MAG: hypothetical protein ACLGIV_05680 [Actinomycetes bacterium]
MSEESANPADVAEQQQDVVPEPDDEETAAVQHEVRVPVEAPEADVWEQAQEVSEDDDEDHRE